MSSMLDMVGAAILFGILVLTVARVQANLNSTMYQNTFSMNTQTAAVLLARQIEHDITKAGYGVTGQRIATADSTQLSFRGALTYKGTVDSIAYYLGPTDTTTINPNDFRFVRYAKSGGELSERLGMTYFRIAYYDSLNHRMNTPVTGASLAAIRGIDVKFRLESLEPVTDPTTEVPDYFAVTWEKLMYPRNLSRPF
jgi:hypothetical protein